MSELTIGSKVVWTNYLAICEENAEWLKEKPREHIIRGTTTNEMYFCMYWSKDVKGINSGVALSFEDNSVCPIVYPIADRFKIVSRHESQFEYIKAKRVVNV